MEKLAIKRIPLSLLLAIVCYEVLLLPFINMPVVLIAFPLHMLIPSLQQTGPHVDVSFIGMNVKSNFARVSYFIYYFVMWYGILTIIRLIKNKINKDDKKRK